MVTPTSTGGPETRTVCLTCYSFSITELQIYSTSKTIKLW